MVFFERGKVIKIGVGFHFRQSVDGCVRGSGGPVKKASEVLRPALQDFCLLSEQGRSVSTEKRVDSFDWTSVDSLNCDEEVLAFVAIHVPLDLLLLSEQGRSVSTEKRVDSFDWKSIDSLNCDEEVLAFVAIHVPLDLLGLVDNLGGLHLPLAISVEDGGFGSRLSCLQREQSIDGCIVVIEPVFTLSKCTANVILRGGLDRVPQLAQAVLHGGVLIGDWKTKPHLGDDEAMIRSSVGTGDQLSHQHVLLVSLPEEDIIQQVSMSRPGVHSGPLLPYWDQVVFCEGADYGGEFLYPKRQAEAHLAIIAALRQTGQTFHDVFPDVIIDSWNHRKPTDPRGGIPVVTFRRNSSSDNGPQNRRSTAFDLAHVFSVWSANKIPQTVFLHTMSPDVEDIVAEAYDAGLISQNTFWTIMDEAGSNMNVSNLITKLNVANDETLNPIKARQRSRPNLAFIRRYPVLRNEDCFDSKLPLDLRSRMRRLFDCRVDHIPWYNETGLLNSLWMFASKTRKLHEPIKFYRTAQLQRDGDFKMTDFGALMAPNSDISGLFPNAFYSFFGEGLRIGCLQAKGFVEGGYLDESGFLRNASGFQIDLLQLLQEQFEFSYELVIPADGEYGRRLSNGSWTGLIGLVVRRKVEFAVGPITISALRAKATQFMGPFQSAHLTAFYRTPAESSNLVRMATPFHWQTWMLIISSIFLSSGLICCLSRFSPYSAWNLRLSGAISDEISIWDNLWNVFEGFVMQAQDFYPFAYSSRILMASWWMYVVLVQAAYQAELVAFLSRSEIMSPFETLEELADDTTITPLIARASNTYYGCYTTSGHQGHQLCCEPQRPISFKKASPESTYARLWKRTQLVSEAEGMEKILASPEFVYIDDEITAGAIENAANRRISKLKKTFAHSFYGFPIVTGTEYMRAFDSYIHRLRETGIIQRLYSKWLQAPERPFGTAATGASMSIDMSQSSGTFILLGISALVSLLSLGMENLWSYNFPTLKVKWDDWKNRQSGAQS
ncbi:unnamed protein product [Schistocephalus solidus]|uniref:Lig_chan-Glu_bd domain-containing protein n=1 Tax=Schistocephalus solidus TaxID=70667 RepID=A0A183SJF1_SCHSO|nr:unnamed protein product [Schistocephalus solidus]